MSQFTLKRRSQNQVTSATTLSEFFSDWKGDQEHWLFVAPHDDDIILGAGLLIQKAKAEGVKMTMLVTTDGGMGYCSLHQKATIKSVRAKETIDSFALVGVAENDIAFLNFPDGSLNMVSGGRFAHDSDEINYAGLTGMQPVYTNHIRRVKPTRIFVPGGVDYHPDHKMTYQELLISVFHAGGDIWPELGAALPWTPNVYEMAIYCDFAEAPDIQVTADDAALEKKLEGVLAYMSQPQIKTLVDNVRKNGSVEYFRDLVFNFYNPSKYKDLF